MEFSELVQKLLARHKISLESYTREGKYVLFRVPEEQLLPVRRALQGLLIVYTNMMDGTYSAKMVADAPQGSLSHVRQVLVEQEVVAYVAGHWEASRYLRNILQTIDPVE